MNERHHRLAIVYTIVFFSLVAALSYWHLGQLERTAGLPNAVPLSEVKIDFTSLF